MTSEEFVAYRKRLKRTQKQMAELLGMSIKAIRSYEQELRAVPPHVERQIYFLLSRDRNLSTPQKACWIIKKCPPDRKRKCPAWEFNAGNFCWFINGTICECKARKNWEEKMEICHECEVLAAIKQERKS